MQHAILALDQGTTSTRVILFDLHGKALMTAQEPLETIYPHAGWVEQMPEAIWLSTLRLLQKAKAFAENHYQIQALGITNQRETTIIWDKASGEAIYPAIVWQDRRTKEQCDAYIEQGCEQWLNQKTGLLIDPYFSATKIAWILDHVPGARKKAENGELLFGTVDSFLIWHLTRGEVHVTDATNASRTSLFNIATRQWDPELCEFFNIPLSILPEVVDSAGQVGMVHAKHLGAELPITGVIGDQQAASLGQGCIRPGDLKCTFGTGAFLLMNTGHALQYSNHRLLSTIGLQWRNHCSYALEGSVFMAGAIMQWLRDGLKILPDVALSSEIATSVTDDSDVMLLPGFQGLGAPFWDAHARGGLMGLTPDTHYAHMTRAALESVNFQTRALTDTFKMDCQNPISTFKVDGGMCVNNWMLQSLSNTLNNHVLRPKQLETTAQGAAFAAGLGLGIYTKLDDIDQWHPHHDIFKPNQQQLYFEKKYLRWLDALACTSDKVKPWREKLNQKRQAIL